MIGDVDPAIASRGVSSVNDARFELRCTACGYGVTVRIAPEECPLCRGGVWEQAYVPYPAEPDVERSGRQTSPRSEA